MQQPPVHSASHDVSSFQSASVERILNKDEEMIWQSDRERKIKEDSKLKVCCIVKEVDSKEKRDGQPNILIVYDPPKRYCTSFQRRVINRIAIRKLVRKPSKKYIFISVFFLQ